MSGQTLGPGGGLPVGVCVPYAGAAAPDGWLICQGQAISRAAYPVLFGVLSTNFGSGDGSTTFNIPDMQGRVAVGVGTASSGTGVTAHTLNQKSGDEKYQLTSAESGVPAHTHPPSGGSTFMVNSGQSNNATAGASTASPGSLDSTTGSNAAAGAASSHQNMQPYIGLNHIIKVV